MVYLMIKFLSDPFKPEIVNVSLSLFPIYLKLILYLKYIKYIKDSCLNNIKVNQNKDFWYINATGY